MTEKRLHQAGDRLRVRRTLGDIRDVTSDDMIREVSYEESADLEGLLQQARLRTRMFGAAFAPPMLERYAVHEQLGKGGMGEVYKARDPELERFVAIKLLQTGLDERARERLSREAQAMAGIEHNHVVRVYDTGTWRGRLFVVMEYMDGTTLREWQEAEKRTWREVLGKYVQAGRGLAKLHAGGLVHRDFKPDNVMLDRDGRVVVGDLGLVHVPDGREQAGPAEGEDGEPDVGNMGSLLLSRTLTRTGTRMGTPRYMSPEQSRGEKTDARSDQFSFCVALYEALYGAMPFAGENERELADAAARGAFEPRPKGRAVPGWLDAIVRRGLMADADARFADMDALLREIARRERRRRTVMWGAVASLPLLVMVSVLAARPTVVTMPAPEDPCAAVERQLAGIWDTERRLQIEANIKARGIPEAELAWQTFKGEFDTWKSRTCTAVRASGKTELDYCMRRDLRWMERVSADFAVMEFEAKNLQAVYDAASELRERSREVCMVAECMSGPQSTGVLGMIDAAQVLEFLGDYKTARKRSEAAWSQAKLMPCDALHAEAGYRLGHVLGSLSQGQAAEEILAEAQRAALDAQQPDLAGEIAIYRAKLAGEVLRDIPRGNDALLVADAMLRLTGRARSDNRHRADYLEARGLLALSDGGYADAAKVHEQALTVRLGLADNEPSLDVSKSYNNLGNALSEAGKTEFAIEKYNQALAIRRQLLGANHPLVAQVLFNLADEQVMLGQNEEARTIYERAYRIDADAYGEDSIELLKDLVALYKFEAGQDTDPTRLKDFCAHIRRIHNKLSLEERDEASRAMEYTVLGACHVQHGDTDAARTEFMRAADVLEPSLHEAAENVLEYVDTLYNLLGVLPAPNERESVCSRLIRGISLITDTDRAFGPELHEDIVKLRKQIDVCLGATNHPSR